MPQVVTIAVPRTGSTHLANHLRAFSGLHVFGEVFHPNQAYTLRPEDLDHISQRWASDLPLDIKNPNTIAWIRSHPEEVFETFAQVTGDRVPVVKLHPSHLDRRFVTNTLLPREDVVAVLVYRRVIDCYASAAKARQTQQWRSVDTTEMQVEADLEHFRGWARWQQAWYTDCRAALGRANRPYHVLTYENDLDRDSDDVLNHLEDLLRSAGIDPGTRGEIQRTTKKQDSTSDYGKKFANWPKFSQQLETAGLLDLATGHFL